MITQTVDIAIGWFSWENNVYPYSKFVNLETLNFVNDWKDGKVKNSRVEWDSANATFLYTKHGSYTSIKAGYVR